MKEDIDRRETAEDKLKTTIENNKNAAKQIQTNCRQTKTRRLSVRITNAAV